MIETVLSWTELPNLHPALVHFPIAFVALAFLFELGGLFARPIPCSSSPPCRPTSTPTPTGGCTPSGWWACWRRSGWRRASGCGGGERARPGSTGGWPAFSPSPAPGDGDALGSVLTAAPGSTANAVTAAPAGDGDSGLALSVDGRALLILPGTFGDVQVEAELDLSGFEGTVGLAHHVRGVDDLGLFTVERPAGRFALTTLEEGEARSLDEKPGGLPEGAARFAVSAIGRHLRGLVDGEMVVHGHEPALPDGACGLLLEGRGTVRVVEMEVIPASD